MSEPSSEDEPAGLAGEWWIPGEPDRQVSGTLDLNELRLMTHDALTVEALEPGVARTLERVDLPVVHGRSHDWRQDLTLLNSSGMSHRMPRSLSPIIRFNESYHVDAAIVGARVDDVTTYDHVRIDLSGLIDWANPRPFTSYDWPADTGLQALHVDLARHDLASAELPDGSVTLRVFATVSGTPRSVEVHHTAQFIIEPVEPMHWREVEERWVWPLRRLVSFVLVRPVGVNAVLVRPDNEPEVSELPRLYTRGRRGRTPDSRRPLVDSDVLFTLPSSPVPFEQLLATWCTRADLERAISALVGIEDASFLYAEHRFLVQLDAAEAVHDLLRTGGRDLDKTSHRQRVERIIEATNATVVPGDDVEWARRVLLGANHKPLRRRLDELVEAAGSVGEEVLGACPSFVNDAVRERTPVTHQVEPQTRTPELRRRLGDALGWLARNVLLMQLGATETDASACVQRNIDYQFMVRRLREVSSEGAASRHGGESDP